MATETRSSIRGSGLPPSARATHAPSPGTGYQPSPVPHDRLAGVHAGHRRLLALTAAVDDAVVARPSLLAGWTVGHLLTHLARDADSHTEMFESAGAGAGPHPRYPGGAAQRDADIEAGASRPAAAIRDDLAAAVARLERAWDHTHIEVWRTGLARSEAPASLADLVFLRWREVEIHTVDLGLADLGGPGWADLPSAYVDTEWAWTAACLPARLPPEVTVLLAPGDRPSRAFGAGPRRVILRASTLETLRWLTGRLPGAVAPPDWPTLTPWE
ncbi:maleylpyruvate isomerase N-terminal domain-containing protein [Frankia sp. CNm7]|uniref:Maleylpyruvate isomerase N-terminal domain-containing protein n=1 Tax=Frankia nepalensis TaxID=1836974 RepID=A0A937UR28_9ACTN|nr:maleylpyruvate isomerase N-terminal domain-containing protein [Frankia nepalensis]MBL7495192.1 maleylpyruvate isomerase N-terminal domain-containing protein [Frankia nepalensis]MBL7510242.1 maleylpyruvate isomerase N-terminal domain-containing protein [Frankia nepalensis]MBL7524856.1 maleylpyruvate isomerase N-terminal domain-containing protein [Frankia nepalensis]MBL7632429.1 maleylpyruvate isomerase N-terminal domain-containing protein [Frankia nepalensis]